MKVYITLETDEDGYDILLPAVRDMERDANDILLIQDSLPDLSNGFALRLLVYPQNQLEKYYSKKQITYSRKDNMIVVSENIAIESVLNLNMEQRYNAILNSLILAFEAVRAKKIKDLNIDEIVQELKK